LSQRFLEGGDSVTAGDILRATSRGTQTQTAGTELARAELDLDQGRARMARGRLKEVISSNTEQSPEALVKLIELQFAARGDIQPEIPELAAAFAVENRGTELGWKLGQARALALALTGKFTQAFHAIPESTSPERDKESVQTRNDILGLLTERADDVIFLTIGLPELRRNGSTRPVALGNEMARRMLDLGFPDAAERLLADPENARNSIQRRILRAEIALARDLPNRALLELSGLAGEDAQRLQARAMARAGNYIAAAAVYQEIPDLPSVARAYWMSGAWNKAVDNGDGKFQRASEIALNLVNPDRGDTPAGPLAMAGGLLKDSARTRTEILRLRQAVATQPPTP
jgi:hypothetical protein